MSFAKNVIATYTAQIIGVVANFICSIIAARLLGVSGQGELALYNNYISFAILLFGFSIPAGLSHFLSAHKISPASFMPLVFKILLYGSVAFLGFTILVFNTNLGKIFFPNLLLTDVTWLLISCLHVVVSMAYAMIQAANQSEGLFKKISYLQITSSLLLLGVYSFISLQKNIFDTSQIQWIIVSSMVVLLFQVIWSLTFLNQSNAAYLSFEPKASYSLKPILTFSSMLFVANLAQFLNYKMDIWFVNYYHHNNHLIGIYALAASLAQILWLLPQALHHIIYVDVSAHPLSLDTFMKTKKQLYFVGSYACCGSIIGIALSPYLIPILFGDQFRESVQIIQILVWGIGIFCLAIPLGAYFAGINRVKINTFSSLLGLIVTLIGCLIFVPKYHILGAAYVSIVSYSVSTLYQLYFFIKSKPHL